MCGSNSDKTNPLQFLQTVVLSFIPKEKGPKYLDKRKFLNFLLLSQYVPRVFRIYLSSKELSRTRDKLITGTVWIRGAFNFFLYLLASHVRVNLSYIYVQKHIVFFFFSGFFYKHFFKRYLEHFGTFSLFKERQHAGTKPVQKMELIVQILLLIVMEDQEISNYWLIVVPEEQKIQPTRRSSLILGYF